MYIPLTTILLILKSIKIVSTIRTSATKTTFPIRMRIAQSTLLICKKSSFIVSKLREKDLPLKKQEWQMD